MMDHFMSVFCLILCLSPHTSHGAEQSCSLPVRAVVSVVLSSVMVCVALCILVMLHFYFNQFVCCGGFPVISVSFSDILQVRPGDSSPCCV